jgi:hypothetical protein
MSRINAKIGIWQVTQIIHLPERKELNSKQASQALCICTIAEERKFM